MNLPVEEWSVKVDKIRPSGQWCKTVVVRIYERHFSSSYDNKLERWQRYWRCLGQHQKLDWMKALDPIEADKVVDRRTDKICGCRLLKSGTQPRDFWENLIEQGLPIALWLKSPSIDALIAKEAIRSITEGEIGKLPTDLTYYRNQGTPKSESFSLLWDNPFQSFPGSRLGSKSVYKSQNTKVS
jgi:vWA-MoxR associated protein C-terminal domain